MSTKADYVRSQGQTRPHTCHWPGCKKQVPPAMWGCREHWFTLPKELRDKVWAAYRPGQEVTGQVGPAYMAAMVLVRDWIADRILEDDARKRGKKPPPVGHRQTP